MLIKGCFHWIISWRPNESLIVNAVWGFIMFLKTIITCSYSVLSGLNVFTVYWDDFTLFNLYSNTKFATCRSIANLICHFVPF